MKQFFYIPLLMIFLTFAGCALIGEDLKVAPEQEVQLPQGVGQ